MGDVYLSAVDDFKEDVISNPVASELFISLFSPSAPSAPSAVKSFRCNRKRYQREGGFLTADSIFAVFCQRGGLTGINADVRSPVGFWWYAGQVGYSEKAIGYLWTLKNF
ncbi:MAG: hypothetical protein WBL95_14265 [Microcoleus sp.]